MEAFDPNLPNPIQKPHTWTSVLYILCKGFAAELLVGCFCGCLAASGLLLGCFWLAPWLLGCLWLAPGCLAAPGCFWAAAMIRRKKYTTNNVHYMYHCILTIYSPYLCVGFLFLVVRSRVLPPPPSPPPPPGLPPPHTTCSHTTCSHTTCSHTTYSHTTCPDTHTHNLLTHTTCSQLVHRLTHSLSTHNLLTQSLFTHNLVTHTHTHSLFTHNLPTHNLLTHNLSTHNLLTHTTCSHTTCSHTTYPHTTYSLTHLAAAVCAAGVALGDIGLHFAWQAWHLATSTCNLPGRRGAYWHWAGSGGGLGPRLAPLLPRLFVWQAWRLATSTFTLRGRHGAWRHQRAFCVAGVALMVLGWLQWRAWAAFGAVVVAPVCAAGVALGDIDVHSAWQVQACRLATSTCILRGSLSQVSAKKQTPVCLLWATVYSSNVVTIPQPGSFNWASSFPPAWKLKWGSLPRKRAPISTGNCPFPF